MRDMIPVGAIMFGGGDVMGMLVAVLVFPSVILSTVGAALGIWQPSALDRAAGVLTGIFSGAVTGVIGSVVLSGYAFENGADVYAFLLGPAIGSVAAYFTARWMTSPT
jgi:hypothetical protein